MLLNSTMNVLTTHKHFITLINGKQSLRAASAWHTWNKASLCCKYRANFAQLNTPQYASYSLSADPLFW